MLTHPARLMATLVLTLGAGLAASPAHAAGWKVDCIWGHVPEAARTAYVAGWTPETSINALIGGLKADPMLGCDIPAAERQDAALALMVYADRTAALNSLQTRFDRPAARVLEAWSTLPQADRQAFSSNIGAQTDDTPQHRALYHGLIRALATKLDILIDDAMPATSIFVRSQGLLESLGQG
jgi:hypothetical protein